MKLYGYIFVCITLCFFSINGIGGRYLVSDAELNFGLITFLRFFGGSLFLLLLVPFFSKKSERKEVFFGKKSILRDNIFWLTAVLLFGTILFFIFGLQFTSASNTVLIHSLAPLVVAIITLFFHPKSSHNYSFRKIFFTVALASIGSSLLMSDTSFIDANGGENKTLGDVLAFLSMILLAFFSFFNVELRRKYNHYNGLLITMSYLGVGALLGLPALLFYYQALYNLSDMAIIFILLTSIGSTGIAYLSWFFAGRYLSAVMLAMLFNIVGLTTIISEYLFYKDVTGGGTYSLLLGMIIILGSVLYINYLSKPNKTKK